MNGNRRITLKKIVSIAIITILTILITEGLTRLFLFDKGTWPVVPTSTQRFDDVLGWSKVPLSHGISDRTGYPIEYRINSKGLRDDEATYEKPEGKFRIVLIGDSFTFGWGVPIDKHYSTLLEGYFNNLEVINMGVEAFGIDQELLYLRLEGFRYEPNLVLAYVPGYYEHRHMYTNRFGRNKPRFILSNGELVLTNSPVEDNLEGRNSLQKISDWLVNTSKAYDIAFHGISALIKNEFSRNQPNNQDDINKTNEAFIKESHELGWAIIYEMHQEAADYGAKFVLVTHIEELNQYASAQQIPSLNVSQPLSNLSYRLPENLKHINESGNGVLAWEIAKFLQENHLVPARHVGLEIP